MAGNGRENADAGLLASLVSGATIANAASRAGIGERTAYRRLDDPSFRAELSGLRHQLLEDTVAEMTAASLEAARTLRALIGEGEAATIRLGAARAILELGIRVRDQAELSGRVDAIETVLETRSGR